MPHVAGKQVDLYYRGEKNQNQTTYVFLINKTVLWLLQCLEQSHFYISAFYVVCVHMGLSLIVSKQRCKILSAVSSVKI